ncbi:MAG TPA: pyridoxal-phosphate dependent enzyme [Burkholderiales bacterium]|nr:pyridoxal-phosphate dependent enzyme [Burkholderiales bacterium]
MPANNLLDLIGNTPMLEITRLDTGRCRLFVKLENQNPAGSIKDRIGLSMIEAAERDGRLKPGGTIVEATAGNTGLGLALVASRKGYRLILVVPDKMAREKIFHLRALGTEVILTRSDVGKGHPEYYQDMAERIAREAGAVYINQFANPANPEAHETTTGPEIWEQMGHQVDAVVCGVGSGGTLAGLSRFFARVSPDTEMVLADPVGSVLCDYVKTGKYGEAGSWVVEGIGEDFIPPIADLSRVRTAYSISDRESLQTARELLNREGILGGSSSGTLVAAALRYCREQTTPKRVVTFICDTGNKYLSKMFNDYWMADQGFIERERYGDLRDVIGRRADERAVVSIGPDDRLMTAYARMKLYDISQIPVLEGERVIGLIDEWDLLSAVQEDPAKFRLPVRSAMTQRLETVGLDTPLSDLIDTFKKGYVAIVVDDGKFWGLITRIDALNYLRHKAP